MKILFPFFVIGYLFLVGCTNGTLETHHSTPDTDADKNEYYSNGNIRIEKKKLENGDEHWIFKLEDGGCWEEKFFRDGDEYKKIIYNSNCVKSAEYELKDGYRHGEWKSYHENGKLREEGQYEDGLQSGIFKYYDEEENLIYQAYSFIIDSTSNNLWGFENDYPNFISYLNNQKIKYSKDDNIEVAGKKDYHFPIIYAGTSTLFFDMDGSSPQKCIKGELNDCSLIILNKICPNRADGGLIVLSGAKWEKGMTHVNVYNLKDETLYQFFLENDQLKSVKFDLIYKRD